MFGRELIMLLAVSAAAVVHAAPEEVMLLGTYHLANNNRDLVNLPIEDILAGKRQQEIERLVDGLARWHPTRIAVEWPHVSQAGLDQRYADYLAGRLKLSANERDQIAFRLAKKLHLNKVEAIDWNNEAPGAPADYDFIDWAHRHGKAYRFDLFTKEGQNEANRTASDMHGQTISQWYRALNDPRMRFKMHQPYFTIASFGSDEGNPGAAWVGAWYARNLRILNNLRELISPGERLFVLYGAGHTYLLSRFIEESDAAVLVDPRKFIPRR